MDEDESCGSSSSNHTTPTKQEPEGDLLQSNLPLLFTNGAPTSLESMTLVSQTICQDQDVLDMETNLDRNFDELIDYFLIWSLQKQLQHFLLFILKCELGVEVKDLSDIDQPEWWPSDVPFDSNILSHNTKKGVGNQLSPSKMSSGQDFGPYSCISQVKRPYQVKISK